jgi:hypothetical protein
VNSLGQTGDQVRNAFREAAEWFATVSEQAGDRLDQEALGVWNVRDLIGHTSRAVTTVETYLLTDELPVEVPTAVDYYLKALKGDPARIAERGRQAGQALGDRPSGAVAAAVERITELVYSQADHARFNTAVGVMKLTEYLPTRTFELTVHTCDLVRALGLSGNVPPSAAATALRISAGLAVARNVAAPLLLALTGRTALPEGFSIVERLVAER